jgi:hypothetical protein
MRMLYDVYDVFNSYVFLSPPSLQGYDSLKGGWYLISVTSSPSQVQAAVRACKEALTSLKGMVFMC